MLAVGLLAVALRPAHADEPATEKLPEGMQIAKLEALLVTIALLNRYAYAQLLVTGVLADGTKIDATRMAMVEDPAGLVKWNDHRLVRPVADGDTSLRITLAGQTISVPVKITGQQQELAVDYVRDVMPTMSKIGCNAGTCHGSAWQERLQALAARLRSAVRSSRLDRRPGRPPLQSRRARTKPDAAESPAGVPHVGGVADAAGRAVLRIAARLDRTGVKFDLETPRVTKIEVFPQDPLIPLPGMKQQVDRDGDLCRRRDARRHGRSFSSKAATPKSRRSTSTDWSPPCAAAKPRHARPLRRVLRRARPSSSWATAAGSPGKIRRPYNYLENWSTTS